MKPTSLVLNIGKFVGLTVGFLICFIVPTMIIPVSKELQLAMQQSGEPGTTMAFLVGFSFACALAISYPIRHARLGGVRLMGAMIVTVFGFLTAMGQIETFYFGSAFPLLGTQEILNIVYRGFLTALLFVPLVVLAWGRMRAEPAFVTGIGWGSWLWKAPLLAVVYMLLYFTFGYYIAWQFPETRQLYTGSTELLGVVDHFKNSFAASPFFAPLQFIRGVLWIAFATPLIVALAGRRRTTIISLVLLGGLFGLQVLLPSPFFPEIVRYAHALETVPSTALYCALIGIVLAPREAASK